MSFIPPIFQKLKILIPSSQACLVFDEIVIAFFLQAMNFIISFYPLVYLSYHYFHVECFNRNRLGDCRGLTIGWWTCTLMLRSVASPYTTFYKWAQMAGSWRQWANFSVVARNKKWPKEKKQSQNTILTKSIFNGRLEPICNLITILLHE